MPETNWVYRFVRVKANSTMDFEQFKKAHGAGRGFTPGVRGSKYDAVVSSLVLNTPVMMVKPADSNFATNEKFGRYIQALGRKAGKAIQQVNDGDDVWVCWVGDFVSKRKPKVEEPTPVEA